MAENVPSRPRVCLGVSGSVAAVKVAELAKALHETGMDVEVVFTTCGRRLSGAEYRGGSPLEELGDGVYEGWVKEIHVDDDEWQNYTSVGTDPVLHIDIAKRCSLLLLAPLCANTLANISLGLCPNLLCSIVRAWPYDLDASCPPSFPPKPVLVAPAMNTVMWHQNITRQHLSTLESRQVHVIDPVVKVLACGDKGKGAMASVEDIVRSVTGVLQS